MRVLIVGCGSIGERHTRNLLSLGQEVLVFDKDPLKEEVLVNRYGVSVYDVKSHHLPIDAFVIATPPSFHIPFAMEALEHDSHIFIEKPISHNLNGVDEVISLAKEKGKVLQVGYQFRFHPGLKAVKSFLDSGKIGKVLSIRAEFGQYLPDWHPNEDYRKLYTCKTGIILDSSHEIDYVRWLASSEVTEVSCIYGKLSGLEMEAEDTAEIILRFENGVIGNIHVDCIQRTYTRWCKMIGERGTIIWDYPRNEVIVNEIPQYRRSKADMYVEEMQNFIRAIEGKEKPAVDGETAKKVLEIALIAKGGKECPGTLTTHCGMV